MDDIDRLSAAVFAHEHHLQVPVEDQHVFDESQDLRWMVLTGPIAAAGISTVSGSYPYLLTYPAADSGAANANPAVWQASANSGAGGYAIDTTLSFTVQEPTGLRSYVSGQWLLCRPIATPGGVIWEPIMPPAIWARGTANQTLTPPAVSVTTPGTPVTFGWSASGLVDVTNAAYAKIQVPGNYLVYGRADIQDGGSSPTVQFNLGAFINGTPPSAAFAESISHCHATVDSVNGWTMNIPAGSIDGTHPTSPVTLYPPSMPGAIGQGSVCFPYTFVVGDQIGLVVYGASTSLLYQASLTIVYLG